MRRKYPVIILIFLGIILFEAASTYATKEFLTDEEIIKVQEAQEIDQRIKIYMKAAESRLETAEKRLMGEESEEGDPLEFFTAEDLVDGYYQIIRSVMLNLDGAYQESGADLYKIKSGLKTLRKGTENAGKRLKILKRIAEDKQKEELWNLVNKSIDITEGAHEGAVYGLDKLEEILEKQEKRRRR